MFCIHPSISFHKKFERIQIIRRAEVRGETERAILYREMIEMVRRKREREILVVAGVSCCLCFYSTRSELAGR